MGKMKELVIELGLTPEQCKDKEIQKFALQVAYRAQTGEYIQYWNGNGYCELNVNNGTLITTVLNNEEAFVPEFPLNCDMNISNYCINGCSFCYQGCSKKGKHANIKKYLKNKNSFLYSLHEGTELAINGNEPMHPDLELLLKFCKERNVFANLTVNELTLLKHRDQIEYWISEKLIHGIGISPCIWSDTMIDFCQKHSNAVIHTIAGITIPYQYEQLLDKNLKVLILGYKTFGKGVDYKLTNNDLIQGNIRWLRENVRDMSKRVKVLSFDNLALEQLEPKTWIGENKWESFYRGDDGNHTLFIDLVNETFAKNSIQPKENHKAILNDIRHMLKEVRNGNANI